MVTVVIRSLIKGKIKIIPEFREIPADMSTKEALLAKLDDLFNKWLSNRAGPGFFLNNPAANTAAPARKEAPANKAEKKEEKALALFKGRTEVGL